METLKIQGQGAGQTHYENLCMKAINQSIGRSVRHREDYASVLLLDHRYQRDNVRNALPKWLQTSLQVHNKFGSAFARLNKVHVLCEYTKELLRTITNVFVCTANMLIYVIIIIYFMKLIQNTFLSIYDYITDKKKS